MEDNTRLQNLNKVTDGNTTALKTSDTLSDHARRTSDDNEAIAEIDELEKSVRDCKMPPDLAEKALRSIGRLRRMAKRGSYSGEFEVVEKYIYWITNIPWGDYSQDNLDIKNAKEIMDSTHYGIDTVKNLVLDYLAIMQMRMDKGERLDTDEDFSAEMGVLRGSSANAPVMLFVGLQGVGKTSIAKSIANAMGRKFVRISVGAVGSVQALRGQSRAFLDAEPGQIVKAVVRCNTMNPVIVLDEIDKVSGHSGLLNDVMASLLEILDPEQNSTFIDHYLDYPINLGKIFFICTCNTLGTLSAALLDRMEVIRFTSYSDQEKEIIAKTYTMNAVLKNAGLTERDVMIEENVWPLLIRPVGFDAGLRQLERNLSTLVRSAARKILEGHQPPIVVNEQNLRQFVLPDQGPLS